MFSIYFDVSENDNIPKIMHAELTPRHLLCRRSSVHVMLWSAYLTFVFNYFFVEHEFFLIKFIHFNFLSSLAT